MEIEGTVSTVQFALLRIDGVGISPATLLPSFPTQLHCCFVSNAAVITVYYYSICDCFFCPLLYLFLERD